MTHFTWRGWEPHQQARCAPTSRRSSLLLVLLLHHGFGSSCKAGNRLWHAQANDRHVARQPLGEQPLVKVQYLALSSVSLPSPPPRIDSTKQRNPKACPIHQSPPESFGTTATSSVLHEESASTWGYQLVCPSKCYFEVEMIEALTKPTGTLSHK